MTSSNATHRADVPAWLSMLHGALLHGHPDELEAADTYAAWNDHATLLYQDPTVTSIDRLRVIVSSAASHVVWRFRFGPPTAMSTGLLFGALGLIACLFMLEGGYGFISTYVGLSAVGLAYFGFLVAHYLGDIPPRHAILVTAFAIPGLWANVERHWNDPTVFTDPIISVGAVCGIGAMLFLVAASLSEKRKTLFGQLHVYGLITTAAVVALGNSLAVSLIRNPQHRFVALMAALVEAGLAYTIWRNADSLYVTESA